MTLLVRDEEDSLYANIEFHRAQGVDFFIITDNKSEDSTPAIAKEYEAAGIAQYIYEGDDDYNQSAWVSRMAKLAATELDADWVINNDADEFWWPRRGDLKATFANLPDNANILVAFRHDFVPLVDEQANFFHDMVYRKKVSLNTIGKPLPPKIAHRADPDVLVAQGNHWAELSAEEVTIDEQIDIFHFPIRSYAQFTNKIIKGGQAYARNTTQNAQAGKTWKMLYEEYKKNGLVEFYKKQSVSAKQIEKGLRKGELIADRRLSDYMLELEDQGRPAADQQDTTAVAG